MARLTSSRSKGKCLAIVLLLALSILVLGALGVAAAEGRRAGAVYHCISTDRKVVALTFDDGPHPRRTPRILELLARHGVRATFFMIGKNIDYYRKAAELVAAEGHEIGNHTDTHPHMSRTSDAEIEKELLYAEQKIESLTGEKPRVFRPPEGNCPARLAPIAATRGYSVILWTVDSRDWAGTSASEIVENVMHNVRGGSILLFHDYTAGKNGTLEALDILIPRLLSDGYGFLTVSELLAVNE